MDHFLNFFEDQRFVNWVFNPTPEVNRYWEDYIKEHPEQKKDIEYGRILLSQLQQKRECENMGEITALYAGILRQIDKKKDRKPFIRHFLFPLLKYAAVALVFLSLGIFLVNRYNNSHILAEYQSIKEVKDDTEARLILANGGKIILPENESTIDYGQNGKIIINQKDTIKQESTASESEMNQLIIPYGKNSSIRLPDGTQVYLNAGSILIYPPRFKDKTREVFLSGEGYFEVAHNTKKPFVVRTSEVNIVATGTIFNVSAYPTDKMLETVLVEGSVTVKGNSMDVFKKDLVLKPGEMASYNRQTFETICHQVDVTREVAWHNGYLQFESTDLSRIVLKLERYYNIKIYLDNPRLEMRRITGKLMLREEREKVLGVLASTASLTLYKINETSYNLK